MAAAFIAVTKSRSSPVSASSSASCSGESGLAVSSTGACASTIFTVAEPLIAPSAPAAIASATCSGLEMPKPSMTGAAASARSRVTESARPTVEDACSVPVTPTRETA